MKGKGLQSEDFMNLFDLVLKYESAMLMGVDQCAGSYDKTKEGKAKSQKKKGRREKKEKGTNLFIIMIIIIFFFLSKGLFLVFFCRFHLIIFFGFFFFLDERFNNCTNGLAVLPLLNEFLLRRNSKFSDRPQVLKKVVGIMHPKPRRGALFYLFYFKRKKQVLKLEVRVDSRENPKSWGRFYLFFLFFVEIFLILR